jgi:hypothetical protein
MRDPLGSRGAEQRPRRQRWVPVSDAERRLTLHDLIDSGRLHVGGRFQADYMGKHYSAELLADGRIRFQGRVYGSLSSAGVAVKRAVHGSDAPRSRRTTDGWTFWKATDARAGDAASLRVIRQRVAAGLSQ